jgi:hypothetical protein
MFNSKFIDNGELDFFLNREITYEIDAMAAYKGCPTLVHKIFLKDSLMFIEKYKPRYVVQKIFLSDKNEDYNSVLLSLCCKYNNKELYRPASASLGTTEAYLIMPEYIGNSEYAGFKDIIVKNLSQAYQELSEDRLINSNILNDNIKKLYISKKKEKESNVLELLEDRQKYRVSEVQRYWQCELKHIESYSKTMWFNMGIHQFINGTIFFNSSFFNSSHLIATFFNTSH